MIRYVGLAKLQNLSEPRNARRFLQRQPHDAPARAFFLTHLTAARVQNREHLIHGPAALGLNARGIES